MIRFWALLLCTVLPGAAWADDDYNQISLDRAKAGDILLFDGESLDGWKTTGKVSVANHCIVLEGKDSAIEFLPRVPYKSMAYFTSKNAKNWGIAGSSASGKEGSNSAIIIKNDGDEKLYLHTIILTPANMTSIFNGKDLSGWRTFSGDKKDASKFTVTKDGYLNVKDGPGDLQTEAEYANFTLQFDCISNGKHLNSGLFFRCIPKQYQQGYEAQIRNQWEGDDRKKPVDFGTGGIYRRKPTRMVRATDNEWFTMTINATDKHLATWVNGYPVCFWTDDRKENDNARQGAKTTKGCLSIQGHDPTTDLSFRNFKISSLDK